MVNKKVTRRDLFISGARKTAAIGIAAAALPQAVKGATDGELATLVDLGKCIGCEACVYACKESNAARFPEPKKPFPEMYPRNKVKPEDWSEKRDDTSRLTPYNWLYIQKVKVKVNGIERELNIPRRCMHCQNPPCANLCPWGALHKYENGISQIDSNLCLGGAKCKDVCPWKIPQRQTGVGLYLDIAPKLGGNGVMYKCDRCLDKIKADGVPECISACPQGVQKIGPRAAIVKEAEALVRETGGFLYGLHENGGTNTIYVSPAPFDEIDAALEKGDGKPHFAPVEDRMKKSENLSKAMIIAPLAVIAATIGKNYRTIKNIVSGE